MSIHIKIALTPLARTNQGNGREMGKYTCLHITRKINKFQYEYGGMKNGNKENRRNHRCETRSD